MTSNEFGSTYSSPQAPVGGYAPGAYTPPAPATYGSHTTDTPASGGEPSTADVAKDQAASVAGGAADAAKNVAGVAKEQVGQVTAEAGKQVKQLLGQAQSELSEQAGTQQARAASGLHAVGDQLKSMAQGSDQPGMATDLAHQAADKAHQIAGWLEDRDPGSVLNEVRTFARQRPGMFLAIAVGAGLVAGRLARGLAADPDEMGSDAKSVSTTATRAPAVGYAPRPAALTGTATGPDVDGELYGTGQVPDWTGKSAGEWGAGR